MDIYDDDCGQIFFSSGFGKRENNVKTKDLSMSIVQSVIYYNCYEFMYILHTLETFAI